MCTAHLIENWQKQPARDFGAGKDLKGAGILCVFQAFQTAFLCRKIRWQPQTIFY